jgi:pimeloyl-ACP methyl ester carboxylesterase
MSIAHARGGAEVAAGIDQSPALPAMAAIAHTLPYDLEICADSRLPVERLGKIQISTLVLAGEKSPAWSGTSMRAVTEAIPGARLTILAGQDRGAADEVLAPVLTDFLLGRQAGRR